MWAIFSKKVCPKVVFKPCNQLLKLMKNGVSVTFPSSLSENALKTLISPEGKGAIAAILGQHLIPKSYLYSNDLRRKDSVKTLHGNKLKISEESNVLQLEEAHILLPGIAASNAVIFPIDKVLPAINKTFLSKSI